MAGSSRGTTATGEEGATYPAYLALIMEAAVAGSSQGTTATGKEGATDSASLALIMVEPATPQQATSKAT